MCSLCVVVCYSLCVLCVDMNDMVFWDVSFVCIECVYLCVTCDGCVQRFFNVVLCLCVVCILLSNVVFAV